MYPSKSVYRHKCLLYVLNYKRWRHQFKSINVKLTLKNLKTINESYLIRFLPLLSGELMRSAINALGAGNMESCFVLLEILQSMAEEFGKLSKQVKLELLLKMNYGKL